MDFLHRNANNQPQSVRSGGSQPSASVSASSSKKSPFEGEPRWLRVTFVVLLFSLTILAVAIASLFYFGKEHEANYVNKDRVQAVFLTNGQVYFGKVADINSKYVDLQDIYYLNSQQQPETSEGTSENQTTSFSLVKLGCELHGPNDQMIINREQVSFWENLSSDGKVAKAIEQWRTQNPDGQKCEDTSNSTQQSTGTEETENSNTDESQTNGQ